ncbi:MAG: hypothetical protein EON60_03295 [Alphaproteobacteria bacterium]|nr:MAG: hypothetical protein EON60_03295 [Alphaproteobacteria bacterium]
MEDKRSVITDHEPVNDHTTGFFALEFARVQNSFDHLSVEEKRKNMRRWIHAVKHQKPSNIPAPTPVEDGILRLTQLHKTDPRDVFAGLIVGCCMHPQGWAAVCAWHGHESPDGAFWVVERYGVIVAAAWVWRCEDNLVIDSVEINDKQVSTARIHPMYIQAAASVLDEKITRVYAGTGYNDSWIPASENCLIRPFPAPVYYRYKEQFMDDSHFAHIIADKWE